MSTPKPTNPRFKHVGRVVTVILTGAAATILGGLVLSAMGVGNSQPQQQGGSVAAPPSSQATIESEATSPEALSSTTPLEQSSSSTPDNQTIVSSRIEITNDGSQIGPSTWPVSANPGYEPYVFTPAGRIDNDAGCYVNWEVYDNDVLLDTHSTRCAAPGGFSEAYWPRLKYKIGTIVVNAHVSTDWGATSDASIQFEMV